MKVSKGLILKLLILTHFIVGDRGPFSSLLFFGQGQSETMQLLDIESD